jgi:hypothetical protein
MSKYDAGVVTHVEFTGGGVAFGGGLRMAARVLASGKSIHIICLARRELDGHFSQGIEPLKKPGCQDAAPAGSLASALG